MASDPQPYSPKVAIVTGAAQGIGRGIALRLAQDGLDVVVNDLPSQQAALDELVSQIRDLNRRALACTGDVSIEADVKKLVEITVKEMKGLDVMIANAGIGYCSPFISTPVEDWDRVQNVNVRSAFLCYREAATQMIKQGRGGRIIGACSLYGKQALNPFWSLYIASKFAVRGLTQATAKELAPYGITVNAYAPGAIKTAIWDKVDEVRDSYGLHKVKDKVYRIEEPESAAYRVGEPDDVAGLVSYLVKPESKFMTGQCINIGGDQYFD